MQNSIHERALYLMKVGSLLLILVIAKSCETVKEARVSNEEQPLVLLISLDGFRFDYLDKTNTPVLDSLVSSGVMAESLIPVFPSKTFPNHYTQVTGLYPENHGIISNRMYDPDFDEYFSIGSASVSAGDGKWYRGEPIWVTARKQGLISAAMFWPGSDAEINGTRPHYYFPYNGAISEKHRISQVIDWLAMGLSRPQIITMYFEQVDGAGHLHGPNSKAIENAIEGIDMHLGQLFGLMEKLGLHTKVDVVIVSDHGMAELSRERVIFLDDYLDLGEIEVVNWSPITEIIPISTDPQVIYHDLNHAHPHLQVYLKDSIPENWHFNNNSRTTPVLAVADPGWSVSSSDYFANHPQAYTGGSHGYPPNVRSMHGIFIATGPSFQTAIGIGTVESIHLYELLCRLLGIVPAKNDGRLEVWTDIIK